VALYAPLGALATAVARLSARRAAPRVATTERAPVGDEPARAPAELARAAGRVSGTSRQDADEAALPIDDYDHLAASQILDRLAGLTSSELELVAAYERAHRHRQTVLGRVAQLLP